MTGSAPLLALLVLSSAATLSSGFTCRLSWSNRLLGKLARAAVTPNADEFSVSAFSLEETIPMELPSIAITEAAVSSAVSDLFGSEQPFDSSFGYSHRERHDRKNSLFLGNLPFTLTEEDLSNALEEKVSGLVESVFIVKNIKSGVSRGYAYANFRSSVDRDAAQELLQELYIGDRAVRVDKTSERPVRSVRAIPMSSEEGRPRDSFRRGSDGFESRDSTGEGSSGGRSGSRFAADQDKTVYFGNLPYDIGGPEIEQLCNGKLGEGLVKRVRMLVDPSTGSHRGYVHVDFFSSEAASQAVEQLSGVELGGRKIKVSPAMSKADLAKSIAGSPRGKTTAVPWNTQATVFLGNLHFDVDGTILKDMISELVGTDSFVRIRVARDRDTKQAKGYAHVEFLDEATARKAVGILSGYTLLGRAMRVDLSNKTSQQEQDGASQGYSTENAGGQFDNERQTE